MKSWQADLALALLCMIAARGERAFLTLALNLASSVFFVSVIINLWKKR